MTPRACYYVCGAIWAERMRLSCIIILFGCSRSEHIESLTPEMISSHHNIKAICWCDRVYNGRVYTVYIDSGPASN